MNRIRLKLNVFHEAILKKEFKSDNGALKLTRHGNIGKFIYSQVQWEREKPDGIQEEGVEIILPSEKLVEDVYFYPCLKALNIKNIVDYLDAVFTVKVELFFVKGYRHKFLQRDIVDAFIYHYGLPGTITSFEMIKQRDFRKRTSVKRIISDFIAKN